MKKNIRFYLVEGKMNHEVEDEEDGLKEISIEIKIKKHDRINN